MRNGVELAGRVDDVAAGAVRQQRDAPGAVLTRPTTALPVTAGGIGPEPMRNG